MCVILACYTKYPSFKELEASESKHGHGAGVAWREPDPATKKMTVRWVKGLNLEKKEGDKTSVIEVLEKLGQPTQQRPVIIHFRTASEGGQSLNLTHPFPLDGLATLAFDGKCDRGVLMHNGTANDWRQEMRSFMYQAKGSVKMPGGNWSDSRYLAFMAGLLGEGILNVLPTINKVCLLTPTRIDLFGENWDRSGDGFIASNDSWQVKEAAKGRAGFPPSPPQLGPGSGTTQGTSLGGELTAKQIKGLIKEMNGRTALSGVTISAA